MALYCILKDHTQPAAFPLACSVSLLANAHLLTSPEVWGPRLPRLDRMWAESVAAEVVATLNLTVHRDTCRSGWVQWVLCRVWSFSEKCLHTELPVLSHISCSDVLISVLVSS